MYAILKAPFIQGVQRSVTFSTSPFPPVACGFCSHNMGSRLCEIIQSVSDFFSVMCVLGCVMLFHPFLFMAKGFCDCLVLFVI